MKNEIGPAYSHSDSAEEQTTRLEAALQRSEKLAMAGRLAASVMHEINNPSQAIGELVYLIAKEADKPELVRCRAAQIEEQLARIQYVARQTLSFFRDSPQTQARDLVPLVDSAMRYHAQLIREKRIQVFKSTPQTMVAWVYPGDFLQMLSNLVRNAVEAMPAEGKLHIRLRAVRTPSGTLARMTVSDSGRGIPSRIKGHLFEAFQSDKAEAGNGLGLWICKTISDKHRGRIRVRSSQLGPRTGTTFMVTFPLQNSTVVPFRSQSRLA